MGKYPPQDGQFPGFLDPDYVFIDNHNYGYKFLRVFMIEVCTPIYKDLIWENLL